MQDPVSEDDPDMDVKKVYTTIFSIMKLKRESLPSSGNNGQLMMSRFSRRRPILRDSASARQDRLHGERLHYLAKAAREGSAQGGHGRRGPYRLPLPDDWWLVRSSITHNPCFRWSSLIMRC